jgi:hypothetical protein
MIRQPHDMVTVILYDTVTLLIGLPYRLCKTFNRVTSLQPLTVLIGLRYQQSFVSLGSAIV